jgi:hypothetical protein
MGIDTRELGGACKSCDNCIYSDEIYEIDSLYEFYESHEVVIPVTVCFAFDTPEYKSKCHVCHYWKGQFD